MDFRSVYMDLRVGDASEEKPLILEQVLFCPVLSWVCRELLARGAQRFFIVCDESWKEAVESAVSDIAGAEVCTDAAAVDVAAEECVTLTGTVLPVEGDVMPFGWLRVESRGELLAAAARCRAAVCEKLLARGVTVIDPDTTYVDPRAEIGAGTVVMPNTIIRGASVVGEHCEIGPNTMIRDCTVGEHTTVNASQINESVIGNHVTVGPFAYVRPNCRVGDHCRIGDFVELKNSVLDEGTKVSHFTYVGDSDIGKRVNFGCGTVTTNYDGVKKYRCTVGDDVFLGCNTNLVAPVKVGEGAYTAAGSIITEDVPAGALAMARARQENKQGWVQKFFAKKR
ncbi:MAG: glucosamine-1-phosphate N-acetyltransferase [Oscillospiraceae bacterium]|nr:glucosamine-1-phosphate N-acetyltransferase [Oscillospiraceae bacterium]